MKTQAWLWIGFAAFVIGAVASYASISNESWRASFVANCVTNATALLIVNIAIGIHEDRRRKSDARLASYVMTSILLGCFEVILKAGNESISSGNDTWRSIIQNNRRWIKAGADNIRN